MWRGVKRFAIIRPIAIAIPVDPAIEITSPGDSDIDWGGGATGEGGGKCHAIFVISVEIIAGGAAIRLSITFSIDGCAKF